MLDLGWGLGRYRGVGLTHGAGCRGGEQGLRMFD